MYANISTDADMANDKYGLTPKSLLFKPTPYTFLFMFAYFCFEFLEKLVYSP